MARYSDVEKGDLAMKHLCPRRAKTIALLASCGMVFSGLSCVSRAAETVTSGVTFVGSTGAFGIFSPAAVQIGSGIDFVSDLIRLFR
jgi:hypothetical protein